MITHASTSSVNPTIWREVFEYLMVYWQRSPYESRTFDPSINLYSTNSVYRTAFNIQSKLPVLAAYHTSNFLPFAKKMRAQSKELKLQN